MAGADVPSDAWAGEVLPDSTWTKTVTLKQAKKAGVHQAQVPSNFGEDGLMPLTFVFESDSWAIMVVNDDGAAEPGDLGTLTYDDQGRLVTTSNSEGCPGCVITLRCLGRLTTTWNTSIRSHCWRAAERWQRGSRVQFCGRWRRHLDSGLGVDDGAVRRMMRHTNAGKCT